MTHLDVAPITTNEFKSMTSIFTTVFTTMCELCLFYSPLDNQLILVHNTDKVKRSHSIRLLI